ncbi:MAG: oligosaccharide flippase family protein [Azoarcus sp.]|nr:oligosaccharide flippase family protein [Azoarcus sp.]
MTVSSLKSRTVRASGLSVIGHFASLALRLVSSIILTRLLKPELFGILAVITAIQIIIALLTDVGIYQAVVQSARAEEEVFRKTAWTVHAIRGFVIFAICAVIAGVLYGLGRIPSVPLGPTYGDPALPALIVVNSLSAAILGLQSMKYMMAKRSLHFGKIIIIDLALQAGGLVATVAIAVVTHSIWSYVIGGLLGSLLLVLMSHYWLDGPKDGFLLDRQALKDLSKFGRWIFMSSVLSGFAQNGDRLLLATLINSTELGYYSIASNLAAVPAGVADRVIGMVGLPALSEIAREHRSRLREIYWRLRTVLDVVATGMAGLLFATGQLIVDTLYDNRYAAAGHMLQILSFSLLFLRCGVSQNVYLALGLPRHVTALSLLKLMSIATFVPMFYWIWGLDGAIAGFALHMLPSAIYTWWVNQRLGLNQFWFEVALLGSWLLGWLGGDALVKIAGWW